MSSFGPILFGRTSLKCKVGISFGILARKVRSLHEARKQFGKLEKSLLPFLDP